jgi:chaperone LolA
MRKLFMLMLLLPLVARAEAIAKLKEFMASTHSAQAKFTQEVTDQNGKRMQTAMGEMQFQRPGKFRWVYQKPYEQVIVGDGAKFWLYDADLNQVSVKKLDAALGSNPAALLAGGNEIEQGYSLQEDGGQNSLEWVRAVPKSMESGFDKIRIGFDAQGDLAAMELDDAFGHKTTLRFSSLQRNPKISAQQFHFTPPKGADVIGE